MAQVHPKESDEVVHADLGDVRKIKDVRWIKMNIKMRRCSYYIPTDETENNNMCQCGYYKKDHEPIASSNPKREAESPTTKLKWDFLRHTDTAPTNAFGEIEFVGFGANIGKFVRVDRETNMCTMLELMMDVWGIAKPKLLISVTGGTKNFDMKPHLRDVFLRGLMKAANSTGAWIITGGTHAGVMKYVGEAVKDHGLTFTNETPAVAIGIAPWGVIQNRHTLEGKEGSWPARYHVKEHQNQKESFLDPNHSHFILVDNGTQHTFSTEIPFRAKLEQEISEIGNDAMSVPIIILVLEGGPDTLETIENALERNRPTVVVKGSGRAADILAYAFKHAEMVEIDPKDNQGVDIKITKKHLSPSLQADIRKQMKDIKFCPEKEIDLNIQRINDCLAKSELICIFEWDLSSGAQDIDMVMLKAVLKANKNEVMDQLKLAFAWNRIDITRSEIFTDDKRWTDDSLDDIMLLAIQQDRVDFVELFLYNGINLKKFLTTERLLTLYNNLSSRSFLKIMLHKMFWRRLRVENNLTDVGNLIATLLDHPCENRYANIVGQQCLEGDKNDTEGKKQYSAFDDPAQELFIWSVLNVRQEMAKLFWLHGKDAIATALVANSLLNAMSYQTDDKLLLDQIKENASDFTTLAIGVLKECYSRDEEKTMCLLIQTLKQWRIPCIQIAMQANNKQFISEPACQVYYNKIWMGEMTQENSSLMLLICIVFPPLVPLLIKFKENEYGELTHHDQTSSSSVQMKQKPKPPLIRGNTEMSLEQSHPSPQVQGTRGDSDNEAMKNVRCLSTVKKFSFFYQAPFVVFFQSVICYIAFLVLYSYALISEFNQEMSVVEIILIVWFFTISIEELRKVAETRSRSLKTLLYRYFINVNNIDSISVMLFTIGMILKGIHNTMTFEAARVLLGVNVLALFLKLAFILSVHRGVGQVLIMIKHLVSRLAYLIVIIVGFIVAYAIASHAILYPNTELSLENLTAILRRPYWNIYGELMLEEVEGAEDCTNDAELFTNGTYPRCPTVSGKYIVPVLMGVYMFMCNTMLLNLLIIMYSYTFKIVKDMEDMHCCFQRHRLINQYCHQPILPPPFILFVHVFKFIRFTCRRSCQPNSSARRGNSFLKHSPNEHELCQWEHVIAQIFYHKKKPADLESIDYRVETATSRLEQQLVNKIDELREQQQAEIGTIEARMQHMEKQLNSMLGMLQQIVESHREHQLGAKPAISEITDARIEAEGGMLKSYTGWC